MPKLKTQAEKDAYNLYYANWLARKAAKAAGTALPPKLGTDGKALSDYGKPKQSTFAQRTLAKRKVKPTSPNALDTSSARPAIARELRSGTISGAMVKAIGADSIRRGLFSIDQRAEKQLIALGKDWVDETETWTRLDPAIDVRTPESLAMGDWLNTAYTSFDESGWGRDMPKGWDRKLFFGKLHAYSRLFLRGTGKVDIDLTVFRGMTGPYRQKYLTNARIRDKVVSPLNELSSWSLSLEQARDFAKGGGVVMSLRIPLNNVAFVPNSARPQEAWEEKEVVYYCPDKLCTMIIRELR